MHDQYSSLADAESVNLTNPTDHLGRSAAAIARIIEASGDPGESLCPECLAPLGLRGGNGTRKHLYHVRGDGTRDCGGAHETAWHLACKYAARSFGMDTEKHVSLPGGSRRADAYRDGEFLEFVHSPSKTYLRKAEQLSANGIACRWLFDSAASFSSQFKSEMFCIESIARGVLRVQGLFKPKIADLIDSLGHGNCFAYYRWAVWRCVGRDEWEVLPQDHELQVLCTSNGGINKELIIAHARSKEHGYEVMFRPKELRTSWNTQVEYLIDEVCSGWRELQDDAASLRAIASAKAVGAKLRESATPDNEIRIPACKREGGGRYLTHSQVQQFMAKRDSDRSEAIVTRAITSSRRGHSPLPPGRYTATITHARWVKQEPVPASWADENPLGWKIELVLSVTHRGELHHVRSGAPLHWRWLIDKICRITEAARPRDAGESWTPVVWLGRRVDIETGVFVGRRGACAKVERFLDVMECNHADVSFWLDQKDGSDVVTRCRVCGAFIGRRPSRDGDGHIHTLWGVTNA